MTLTQLRNRLALFAVAAASVAGYTLLPTPGVEPDPAKQLPTGYKYTALYGSASGLPDDVCALDCESDPAPAGLALALCETRGPGIVRNGDGTRSVEGFWFDSVKLVDDQGRCMRVLRQHRAQEHLARAVESGTADGGYPTRLLNGWQLVTSDPGWGVRWADLPAPVRTLVRSHKFAGMSNDDRPQNDNGEVADGGPDA